MLLLMLIYYTFNRMNITIIVKHDNNNKYIYQWYTIIYILKFYYIDDNYNNEGDHGYN